MRDRVEGGDGPHIVDNGFRVNPKLSAIYGKP